MVSIISFLIFFSILGLLILVHEWGHFIMARRVGVRVEKFSLGFGPSLLVRKRNGTEYSLSAVPLGGYVKLAGDNLEEYKGAADEYYSKPPKDRAKIVFFGPLLNYILGFLCFWFIFFVGYPSTTSKVGGLEDGMGAQEAGVLIGDKILALDGQPVKLWEDLQDIIQQKKAGDIIKATIERDGATFDLDIRIKEKEFEDALKQKEKVGLIGITRGDEFVITKHGLAESFLLGLKKTWDLTDLTYRALWRMVTGRLSFKDSVTGPLGIFYITNEAARLGIIAVLHLIAVLNVSLAIFNLLPFPVLDGGHIVLLAFEKIRGKALSLKAERVISQVGLSLIVTLALVVTYNDILKFGDKIFKWFGK